MTAIWWPTVRATSWAPLAGAAACLVTVMIVASGGWPAGLLGIGAGALAAAQVAAMRDPAAALLAAVPVSAAARRARRLALLGPAGLTAWLATAGGPVLAQLTLLACGLAVALWYGVVAGTGVPLAWVALAWSSGLDWELHPAVLAAAVVVIVLGRNR